MFAVGLSQNSAENKDWRPPKEYRNKTFETYLVRSRFVCQRHQKGGLLLGALALICRDPRCYLLGAFWPAN